MRIVKRPELLKILEKENIIYSEVNDYVIDGLYEGLCSDYESDFIYNDLLTSLDVNDSDEYFDTLANAKDYGVEFRLDLDCTSRDGLFNDDQEYMIYDKEDIKKLVDKLSLYL